MPYCHKPGQSARKDFQEKLGESLEITFKMYGNTIYSVCRLKYSVNRNPAFAGFLGARRPYESNINNFKYRSQ